jgi:hypothetical protein
MKYENHIAEWRKNWLTSIAELSNIDEQRRLWLDAQQANPHSSFVEYMNSHFDDLFIGNDFQDFVVKGMVTPKEAVCVREFYILAQSYTPPQNDDYDHAAILDDPNWVSVVNAAAEAKRCLLAGLDEDETKYLTSDGG